MSCEKFEFEFDLPINLTPMKPFFFTLMMCGGLYSYGQNSINSAGGTISNNSYQLDFSLGILSSQILESDSGSVSPGAIQPGSKSETGILELPSSKFQIYPNPASEWFSISGKNGKFNVTIQDALGRQIQSSPADQPVNISHLPNGYYTILIENISFKLLKTN